MMEPFDLHTRSTAAVTACLLVHDRQLVGLESDARGVCLAVRDQPAGVVHNDHTYNGATKAIKSVQKVYEPVERGDVGLLVRGAGPAAIAHLHPATHAPLALLEGVAGQVLPVRERLPAEEGLGVDLGGDCEKDVHDVHALVRGIRSRRGEVRDLDQDIRNLPAAHAEGTAVGALVAVGRGQQGLWGV